jgi:uncharacterized protein (TIGR03437 family)
MLRKSWTLVLAGILFAGGSVWAGTFGKVVAIGGASSDLALDEPRGVLYIANLTANRIDVMSLATNTIQTSINVAANPSSIAISPDDHWLIISHFGNNTAPAQPNNVLTLIDLTANNAKQTFALGNPPLGVAFGLDNKALVVTTTEYILFDPIVGSTQTLATIQNISAKALPVPAATFPPEITSASVATSADGLHVYGMGNSTGTFTFRYDVATHAISPGGVVLASGTLGPRVVSLSRDGSQAMAGWVMIDSAGTFTNYLIGHSNQFSVGTTVFDSKRNFLYAQIPVTPGEDPVLQVLDSDNLTLRQRLSLPENTSGKSVMNSDQSVMYSVSASGILVLPVGSLNSAPRLAVSTPDMVFRGNFCDRSVATQPLTVTDPGGGHTPFTISGANGVSVSPSSGVTPATVNVSVDPNVYQNQQGTSTVFLTLTSPTAVNLVNPVRLLINSRQPDQRGTFVNIPGIVVDVLADPVRNRYYVLRQDTNEALVFDGSNNTQIASLRTYNNPTSMAIMLDNQHLLISSSQSQAMAVYDLDSFQAGPYIKTEAGAGNAVRSVAVTTKAILATSVDYTNAWHVLRVDPVNRTSSQFSTLGVFENKITAESVVTTSSNGSKALVASPDGKVYLYDANVDSFTVSRSDFQTLNGAYAASPFDQFVVGNNLLNASLVPVGVLGSAGDNPSGFLFVDNGGVRTTSPGSANPGVIERVDLSSGSMIRPTRMVEAPTSGTVPTLQINQTVCTTTTNAGVSTTTCQGPTVTTVETCTGSTTNSTCTTTTAPTAPPVSGTFVRSLALMQNRSQFVSLTTSGITVLPYTYDAAVASPKINAVVSAADSKSAAAPGGLISIYGTQLSPTNLATNEVPLPTALGNSCLTINGLPLPLIFVSPTQVNAQMPFQATGNVTMIVHTPGGVSDNFNVVVPSSSPAVFLSGVAGPETTLPTIVRASNSLLATDSNPVHHNDVLAIYLTGLGAVTPTVANGVPGPSFPLATTLTPPTITLGGVTLPVIYSGLAPGQVGVNQINVTVPSNVPPGLALPLVISQGGATNTLTLRVVD